MKENNSKITDFDTLSYSKASSFNNCERKFSFSYVEKIRTESGIHAAVGTFVHELIEEFFNRNNFIDSFNKDSEKELGYLTSLFEKHWDQQKHGLQKLYDKDKRTPTEYESLEDWIKTLIKNYIELEIFISQNSTLYPDLQITNNVGIFNEKKFTKQFSNEKNTENSQSFELQGYIDRLVFNNELLQCSIVDIKTGKPSSFDQEDKKDQIRTYQYLVTKGNSEDFDPSNNLVVTNGYLFYLGGKNIDPNKRIVKVSEDDFIEIDNFIYKKFEKTLENILSKRNLDIEIYNSEGVKSPWKAKKQVLCSWCDYKSVCDEWVEEIIDSNSVYPVNQAFKKLRHLGGIDSVGKLQSTKTIVAFKNTDKTLDALLTYFNEVFKPFLKIYIESLKTQEDIDDVKLVESNLKKFIKQATSEDELINSEIKKILLQLVGSSSNSTGNWELVINGINLIKNNKDSIYNIDFKEFESFLVISRKKWKNSFEENESSISFKELIKMADIIYEYKFFNIKLRTPIKNFKEYLNEFINLILTVDKNLEEINSNSVLSSKNKEVFLKINKLIKLLEKYQNSLESFSKLKIK